MDASSLSIRLQSAYGKLCFAASLFGWLPFFLTQPMVHGGTLLDVVLTWAGLVLGAYGTIELVRVTTNRFVRIILVVWLLPYALLVGFGLYSAAPYVSRLFAT